MTEAPRLMQIRQKPVTRKNRGIHSAIHFDEDCREKFPRGTIQYFLFPIAVPGAVSADDRMEGTGGGICASQSKQQAGLHGQILPHD